MDAILVIREVNSRAWAKALIFTTFMCGANGGTSCPTCHPSCSCTTPGICDSCVAESGATMSVDKGFCKCNSVTEWDGATYFQTCTLSLCHSSCTHCAAPSLEGCMSEEQADFAIHVAATYSLPLTTETNGAMCYRQPVPPDPSCDPLTSVLGNVVTDGAGLHPTADQCYKLLKTSWPLINSWFDHYFPNFSPPVATVEETTMLKAVLKLWILQYGPNEMIADPLWQGLVSTFNNAALDWTKLLAWAGATTGYSADGVTRSSFPADLAASLKQTSPELQLFNHFSKLCTSACGLGTQCRQMNPISICV